MFKVCKKCGTENPESAVYCENCGNKLEPSVDMSAVKDTVTDAAGKAFNGAKNLADQINKKVNTTLEDQKKKANDAAEKQIRDAQGSGSSTKYRSDISEKDYMSSTELWSWLQKDSKRQHFYTEELNTVTQAEYMQKLEEKLQANIVPATVAVRDIQWDRSNVRQRVCCVQPKSSAVNPLSCLVQFNHVGKFTFVEEKTFITPPDLPKVPEKPVKLDADLLKRASWMIWGILIAVIGVLWMMASMENYDSPVPALIVTLVGGALIWYGYSAKQQVNALREHNKKCKQQEKAWTAAWDNWEDSIFLHSFQENINGQISRIYDAVFECIKQLNEEMFAQKASAEQQETRSMNEMEQQIARRKDDYR